MNEPIENSQAGEGRPWVLEALFVLVLVLDMFLVGIVEARRVRSFSELLGAICAPAILTLVVVGVARAIGRAKSRRGTAKVALSTALFLMLGEFGQIATPPPVAAEASPPEIAARYAAEGSKVVPKQVDAETQLESVAAEGATLIYSYRMTQRSLAELEPERIAEFKGELAAHSCANPTARANLLRQGVMVRHVYYDKDKAPIATVDLTEDVCVQLTRAGRPTKQ